MYLPGNLRLWVLLTGLVLPLGVWAADTEEAREPEFPSPDGLYAFRTKSDDEDEPKIYELIRLKSGQAVTQVAESNPELGPSARFDMKVLWRPDSQAFALTATLWKRGSLVKVYARNGSTFRAIPIPELLAEIPDKAMKGKSFPHVSAMNAAEAIRWHQDGSLVVQIQSIQDGENGTITATRTVTLSFDHPGKARVEKSTVKYTTEAP